MPILVSINENLRKGFSGELNHLNIRYQMSANSLGRLINVQKASLDYKSNDGSNIIGFKTPDELELILEKFHNENPERIKLYGAGKTHEGRNVTVVRIHSKGIDSNSFSMRKPSMLIDCGIHAREWLSPGK